MNNKVLIIGEILFIIGASIFYIIKEVVPDLKEEYGSSDRFIKTDYYKNMLEFKIDNEINFGIVINEQKELYHLMFFDKNSLCLYNKNIERSSINKGVLEIVKVLIENDHLKSNSVMRVTKYNDYYYNEFKDILVAALGKYGLSLSIIDEKSTLEKKCKELGIGDTVGEAEMLRNLDYYSKEFARMYNNINKSDKKSLEINNSTSRMYVNNVYQKIEKYVFDNKIMELEKNNTQLVITLLAADDDEKYFPSSNSWYYVKDGKVYAYIELIANGKSYDYCYKGSIDLIQKGVC